MSNKEVKIGLFGFGTIGVGVAKLLDANADVVEEKTDAKIVLKRIVDIDTETDRGLELPDGTLTANADDILDDDEIKIVIELIGGAGIAKEIVTRALEKGKHVVTANKELIAKHGPELESLARASGARLLFEASVGGGIPVLTPLLTCLRGNRIDRVVGIVNGTTNYILTQMKTTGAEMSDVLAEAQSLGYAEADPTSDVEGYDAAYKAIILAAAAFGKRVEVSDVEREGITKISRRDIEYAGELGYTIKLLAVLENCDGEVDVQVYPALVALDHQLATIDGVLNAVYLEGDPIGPLTFVGQGAGAAATSSAVVGDVIDLALDSKSAVGGNAWDIYKKAKVAPRGSIESAFYLRILTTDRPGVLAEVGRCLGECDVSVSSLVQKEQIGDTAEIVMLTHKVKESNVTEALARVKDLECVREVSSVLRIFV